MIGAASIIVPVLQVNQQVGKVQAEGQLANQLVTNVRSWAAGNWASVLALSTGTANTYYLNTATSPFTAAGTSTTSTLNGITYTQYFYLTDVYRDSNGNVTSTASGQSYDPSTKQVSIVTTFPKGPTSTIVFYLTRNQSAALYQSDWSGGGGQQGPAKLASNVFATSTNVVTNVAGQIKLSPPVGGSCQL